MTGRRRLAFNPITVGLSLVLWGSVLIVLAVIL